MKYCEAYFYHPSMNSKMAVRASACVDKVVRASSSHSSVAKKLSAIALSKQWAHSRFPGHALTPTGVMAIRCKQFHLPDL